MVWRAEDDKEKKEELSTRDRPSIAWNDPGVYRRGKRILYINHYKRGEVHTVASDVTLATLVR